MSLTMTYEALSRCNRRDFALMRLFVAVGLVFLHTARILDNTHAHVLFGADQQPPRSGSVPVSS